jgi:hypothetical protein
VAGKLRQDREDRTEHDSKNRTAEDRTLGQDCRDRIAAIGTGQVGQDSWDKTAGTGHSEQDNEYRTSEHDRPDRTEKNKYMTKEN